MKPILSLSAACAAPKPALASPAPTSPTAAAMATMLYLFMISLRVGSTGDRTPQSARGAKLPPSVQCPPDVCRADKRDGPGYAALAELNTRTISVARSAARQRADDQSWSCACTKFD